MRRASYQPMQLTNESSRSRRVLQVRRVVSSRLNVNMVLSAIELPEAVPVQPLLGAMLARQPLDGAAGHGDAFVVSPSQIVS